MPLEVIKSRIRSFGYAFSGIRSMLVTQKNAWIHALATLVVVACGFIFRINQFEWCWILLAIVTVWTAEALNTAFEFLADVASPSFHPKVKKAKDISAAAVLITAAGALLIGLIIFIPYITMP